MGFKLSSLIQLLKLPMTDVRLKYEEGEVRVPGGVELLLGDEGSNDDEE